MAYPTAQTSLAQSIIVTDLNGECLPDIIVATGHSQNIQNGVIANTPGVLLQIASTPGTFGLLQDLP